MASKRHIRRRSCQKKIPYDNPEMAAGAIKMLCRFRTSSYQVYKCQFCSKYHIGRQGLNKTEATGRITV